MHRHSGGHRRDPFSRKSNIVDKDCRYVSLKSAMRVVASVKFCVCPGRFSKVELPKTNSSHIDGLCPRRGDFKQEVKLAYPKLACFSCRAAERAAPRRHPWRRTSTRSRAQLRRRLSQGTLMDEARGPADESETGVCGAGIGRFASRAARCLEQCSDEGGRWRHPRRKLRSETALPHCCLLPRNPLGLLVRRKRDAIV